MNIFETQNYTQVIRQQLVHSDATLKGRGSIKLLASRIGCHPTFISQVIHGKSHFNHDQALLSCKYFQFTDDETDFFMNLLNLERAGTEVTRKYFQDIIDRMRQERKVFFKRAKLKKTLPNIGETLYLSHWTIPVVHAALQLPNAQTVEQLERLLPCSKGLIVKALSILNQLELVTTQKGNWTVTQNALHISKTSIATANFHIQWRSNTAAKLTLEDRTPEDTHYSSIFAISAETAEQVRDLLLSGLQDARKQMLESPKSSRLYAMCLDFYPVF